MKLQVKPVILLTSFLLLVLITGCAGDVNSRLLAAAKKGDMAKVKALLTEGADLTTKDKDGKTALMIAKEKGHTEAVQVLESAGITALFAAVKEGSVENAKGLLEAGTEVNAKGEGGQIPLQIAFEGDYRDIAEILILEGADVNVEIRNGRTPLHEVARGVHEDLAELLISKGADVNAASDTVPTALIIAATKGHIEIVKILLDNGADMNGLSPRGGTALNAALGNEHTEIAQLLKDAGALEESIIWAGISSGVAFEWTTSGVKVKPEDGRWSSLLPSDIAQSSDWCQDNEGYEEQTSVSLLSVVGKYVSYLVDYVCPNGYRAIADISYRIIDASDPTRKVVLTDFFPSEYIRKALLADSYVKGIIGPEYLENPQTLLEVPYIKGKLDPEYKNPFEDLNGLLVSLEYLTASIRSGGEERGEGFGIGESTLSSFAFHHIEGNKIAIRLALYSTAEATFGDLTQLGILLPIPGKRLDRSLSLANRKQEGFLMKDAKTVSNGQATIFWAK